MPLPTTVSSPAHGPVLPFASIRPSGARVRIPPSPWLSGPFSVFVWKSSCLPLPFVGCAFGGYTHQVFGFGLSVSLTLGSRVCTRSWHAAEVCCVLRAQMRRCPRPVPREVPLLRGSGAAVVSTAWMPFSLRGHLCFGGELL